MNTTSCRCPHETARYRVTLVLFVILSPEEPDLIMHKDPDPDSVSLAVVVDLDRQKGIFVIFIVPYK